MSEAPDEKYRVLDQDRIALKIRRMAAEIAEAFGPEPPAFVGILKRGATVADRVRAELASQWAKVAVGSLDINLYRDDLDERLTVPTVQSSDIPFSVEGATVLLFDDVLFTGRTVRAAIDAITDYGRPARISLAVLIDRGQTARELPIRADFVGEEIETTRDEYVRVRFQENDGHEGIYLLTKNDPASGA